MTHLPIDDVIDGMIACAANARKLSQDASRLFRLHRYSSAGAIAITSLEESGKVLLLSVAMFGQKLGQDIDWHEFWKEWRSHHQKHKMMAILDMSLHGKEAASLAIRAFIFEDLEKLRRRFLYVDREGNQWVRPDHADRKWVIELMDAADALSEKLLSECNPKRRSKILKELEEALNNPSMMEDFIANFTEGLDEINGRLSKINGECCQPGIGEAS